MLFRSYSTRPLPRNQKPVRGEYTQTTVLGDMLDSRTGRALHALALCAARLGMPLIEGAVHSSDVFYRDAEPDYWEKLRDEKGCLAVEMESFALFHNAAATKKNAACLLTISDSFVSHEETTAEQRQTSFTNMMEIALGSVLE